jgi:hypothetical protein
VRPSHEGTRAPTPGQRGPSAAVAAPPRRCRVSVGARRVVSLPEAPSSGSGVRWVYLALSGGTPVSRAPGGQENWPNPLRGEACPAGGKLLYPAPIPVPLSSAGSTPPWPRPSRGMGPRSWHSVAGLVRGARPPARNARHSGGVGGWADPRF